MIKIDLYYQLRCIAYMALINNVHLFISDKNRSQRKRLLKYTDTEHNRGVSVLFVHVKRVKL